MIVVAVELPQLRAEAAAHRPHRVLAGPGQVRAGDTAPVLGHENQVNMERGNHVPAAAVVVVDCQRPLACCGAVQVRYRYRIYPSPGQRQALARAFGCARVVYNDCLRLREACHAAGEKVSDTEVQRRVITLAKVTPERAWLGEVASVPLVQACQDARRAYRNWFGSLSGKRKGPLSIRTWTCAACGVRHDRDVNAARNIRLEGRKVAAGQAETLNGCGGIVRPGLAPAGPSETATHRSAA